MRVCSDHRAAESALTGPELFSKGPRRSIWRQLVIAVSGVHAMLMISLMMVVIHHQQTSLMEKASTQTIQQAELLAASIAPPTDHR